MKKYMIILIILVAIVISSSLFAYRTFQKDVNDLKEYNYSFEQYKDKEIECAQIATILNKAVSNNEEHGIKKDENKEYISNDEDSIKIYIHIKDNDTIYSMEKIYDMGVEKFIDSFSMETFKIEKMEYHKKTNKVKYILIKQQ